MTSIYRSGHRRAVIAVAFLTACAAVRLLTIPVTIVELTTPELDPSQDIADNWVGAISVLLEGILAILTLALLAATAVAFLMWLHRVCKNRLAFAWTQRQISYSAGWAVGSFFVPLANLFVPYQAVKELWQKSEWPDTAVLSSTSPPASFPVWWLFWIVSSFASNIYFRMTVAEAPRKAVGIVGMASDLLTIPAAIFAIWVIREIDRRQGESSKRLPPLNGLPVPPPPPVFHTASEVAGKSIDNATR